MQYRLDLILRPAEGAVLRVLGMTERRASAPARSTAVLSSTMRAVGIFKWLWTARAHQRHCVCNWRKCTTANQYLLLFWKPHELQRTTRYTTRNTTAGFS